jgi:cell division protein FtsW
MASRPWSPAATAFSRGDLTPIGRWFWTVDKLLVTLVLALIACGIIAVAAASPAAAHRLSGRNFRCEDLYFLKRQMFWVVAGLPVLFGVSMLPVAWAKRLAIGGTAVFLLGLLLVPVIGGLPAALAAGGEDRMLLCPRAWGATGSSPTTTNAPNSRRATWWRARSTSR